MWLLLLLLSVNSFADDSFVTLGPAPLTLLGTQKEKAFPAGTKARLLKIQGDKAIFEIQGQRYETSAAKASYYFEAGDLGKKFLLGEALELLRYSNDLASHPSCFEVRTGKTCPWKLDSDAWNDALMRRAVLSCDVEPLKIVQRVSKKEFDPNCRNAPGPLDTEKSSWASCAPPPICGPEQDSLKRKQASWRREDEVNKCTQEPKVQRSVQPEAACLLPFKKPVSKLVIHHLEAPMDRGPNEVFNWHRDKGYDDMSYHYIIAKDASGNWRVFEGRPRNVEGAHGGPGSNSDSLGIAIAGCYRTGDATATSPCPTDAERPPPEAVRLLTNLVAKLKKEELGPDGKPSIKEVVGHGQHRFAQTKCHTNCPSPSCQVLVNRLQERFFGGNK